MMSNRTYECTHLISKVAEGKSLRAIFDSGGRVPLHVEGVPKLGHVSLHDDICVEIQNLPRGHEGLLPSTRFFLLRRPFSDYLGEVERCKVVPGNTSKVRKAGRSSPLGVRKMRHQHGAHVTATLAQGKRAR